MKAGERLGTPISNTAQHARAGPARMRVRPVGQTLGGAYVRGRPRARYTVNGPRALPRVLGTRRRQDRRETHLRITGQGGGGTMVNASKAYENARPAKTTKF